MHRLVYRHLAELMEVVILVIRGDKLAVVNTGSDSITIVDMDNDYRCDTFFLCKGKPYLGPHQIIQGDNENILYSTNSYNNSIFKINLCEKQIEDSLIVGSFPSHIDTLDDLLLVTNSDSNSISVIDKKNFLLIENIPVGEKPHDIKVDEISKKVYVANSNNYTIDVLNVYNNTSDTIKLPFKPLHLFLGEERIYVLCPLNNGMTDSKILVINLEDSTIEHSIDVDGVIIDMIILEDKKIIYTTNIDDGFLYKLDIEDSSFSEKHFIGGMPNNLLLHNDFIFITNVLTDNLHFFDSNKKEIIKSINIGIEPNGLLLL